MKKYTQSYINSELCTNNLLLTGLHKSLEMDIVENIRDAPYESILARREINFDMEKKALDTVKKFLIRKKLVLYGGMAMDMAFRLKGSRLYDPTDNKLEDYDFYSPDPINDAYELADILHKEGFLEVNAINALHVTTMRVRLGTKAVADISYIPPNIFKVIPTLKFKDSNHEEDTYIIINPLFQRIDLHESLTEPVRDAPTEVYFNRFAKDIKRFKMLDELYPINEYLPKKSPKIELVDVIIPNLSDVLWVGCISYAIHYKQLFDLIGSSSKIHKKFQSEFDNILELSITQLDQDSKDLYVQTPKSTPLSLYADDFPTVLKELGEQYSKSSISYYNTYLDRSRPRMIKFVKKRKSGGDIEIFDNARSTKTYIDVKVGSVNMKGASAQLTLMYFLQRYFEHGNDIDLIFYYNTLNIVKLTELILVDMAEEKSESSRKQFLNKQMDNLTMFICNKWYGKYNLGDSFSISMQYIVSNNKSEKLDPMRARSYWPSDGKKPINDIKNMHPYHIDGKETEPFKPVGDGWLNDIKLK